MCLHYTFLIFLNTARESDKSYLINHVVYFGLTNRVICEILDRWKIESNKAYLEDKQKLLRKINWIHSRNSLDHWISSQSTLL